MALSPMPRRFAIAALIIFVCLAGAGLIAWLKWPSHPANVHVTKNAPTVIRKPFTQLPADLVARARGSSAYTWCYYSAEWYFTYSITPYPGSRAGQRSVRINIESVDLKLALDTTMYLPKDVPDWLFAHEQGHRRIGEHYYKPAEAVAESIAAGMVGQGFDGEGSSEDAAEAAARDKAGAYWLAEYLKRTNEPAQRAHERYDEITNHGLDRAVNPNDAVKQAIAQTN